MDLSKVVGRRPSVGNRSAVCGFLRVIAAPPRVMRLKEIADRLLRF